MVDTKTLCEFLDQELEFGLFEDLSLNGLQIEGRASVLRVMSAVDVGLSTVRSAISEKADFLLVHHGLFWGKPLPVRGPHRALLSEALAAELNLYAAHLPLDAHPALGNNPLLAKALGLTPLRSAFVHRGRNIGVIACPVHSLSFAALRERIETLFPHTSSSHMLHFGSEAVERVAIVTGSGADALLQFETENFDTLITGEPRQFAFHFARDNHLNVIFAGHYATETFGVRALGDRLRDTFGVEHIALDLPTGI